MTMGQDAATTPVIEAGDLKLLADLMAVVADPAVAQERLSQLALASEEARALLEEAKTIRKTRYRERVDHESTLARQLEDHEFKVKTAQEIFDKAVAEREREL